MIYKELGKSGIKVSVVTMGTWSMGGDPQWGERNDAAAIAAIQAGLDHGINYIDTALTYGLGHSERIVGQAIRGRRSEVVLQTKCGLSADTDTQEGTFHFERYDGVKLLRNLSRKAIRKNAEESLKNLGTDYIDMYMTHWQSVEPFFIPISETMDTLLELKKEGKIRAIGVSNVTPAHVEEYLKYGRIDLIQEKYSMLDRENVEKSLMPIAERHQMTLQAYSPLEQGLLTGRVSMDTVLPAGDVRNRNAWYKPENRIRAVRMLDGWKPLSDKYQCSLTDLVIAWTLAQSFTMNVLTGGRKPQHVIENAAGGSLALDRADVLRMTQDIDRLQQPG